MPNAQEWLSQNYPNKEEVRVISGEWKQLTGEIIITNFPQVEKIFVYENELTQLHLKNCPQLTNLSCGNNELTKLILTNCPNLQTIYAYGNHLTSLDLSNNQQLEILSIGKNNFSSDLSFLSHLVNLKTLYLYNNNFTGSLEPLRNLNKLETLYIDYTKLSQGLEYLPASVTHFSYQGTKLEKEFEPFGGWKNWCGWKEQGFTEEEIKQWISVGAAISDYEFANWLKDVKKLVPQWVSENKEKFEDWKSRYKNYGLCENCQEFNTSEKWCQPCFERLTGQKLVERFIERQQQTSNKYNQLQWISYEQFTNIKHLANGGFGNINKAEWSYQRVALKILNNSQNITWDFLQEIANVKLIDDNFYIVECHGISRDPETKNYVMVMDYKEGGNLREYLKSKARELTWEDKFNKLSSVANGLDVVHNQGLIHCDFHSGNILSQWNNSYITDFGLSRLVSSQAKEGKICGVLPYVAPELLQGRPYTKETDVYSWGIIAYEIFANASPYLDRDYDISLSLEICQGLRPNLDELKIPQLLKDLIKKCWDTNAKTRPTIGEIRDILSKWQGEIGGKKNSEFTQQLQEIKKDYNQFAWNFAYKFHPTEVLTSKVIDTKLITRKLKEQCDSGLLDLTITTQEQTSLLIPTETKLKNENSSSPTESASISQTLCLCKCLAKIQTKLFTPISKWECLKSEPIQIQSQILLPPKN